MKCIVLSNHSGQKKDGSGTFQIANVMYIRRDQLQVEKVFNLDKVYSGDIVDLDCDMKGFVVDYEVIGHAESVDLLIGELQHL